MRERDIDKALCQRVKELGGTCEKFGSFNRRGVPDRLVILPHNLVIFVELKAPGQKPTRQQTNDHKKRLALGCDVRVIDSLEKVRVFPNVTA